MKVLYSETEDNPTALTVHEQRFTLQFLPHKPWDKLRKIILFSCRQRQCEVLQTVKDKRERDLGAKINVNITTTTHDSESWHDTNHC